MQGEIKLIPANSHAPPMNLALNPSESGARRKQKEKDKKEEPILKEPSVESLESDADDEEDS